MNNGKKEVSGEAQGAEPVSLEDVQGFLRRDLERCIMLLDAIYRDFDTCNMLAQFLHGRYENARLKDELKKQGDLFPK